MTPLSVTARLAGRVILPHEGLHLDALLIAAVARRDDLPPLTTAADVLRAQAVDIPVAKSPCGRYWLCSVAVHDGALERETRWINKRFPMQQAIDMGRDDVRSIKATAGLSRGFRIPVEASIVRSLTWYAIGDGAEIERLLTLVTRIGRLRRAGEGLVESWEVSAVADPWSGFPVVDRDGEPLRVLPRDAAPGRGIARVGRVRPPYWARVEEEEVACPIVQ